MHRRHALRLGATVGLASLTGCSAVSRLSNETEQTDTSRLRWTREFQSKTYGEPLKEKSTLVHVTETVPDEDSTFSDTTMRLVSLSPDDGSKQWEYVGESDDPSHISET